MDSPGLDLTHYEVPWAHMSHPKQHLDRSSRFCVHRSKGCDAFQWGGPLPKIAPSHWVYAPHLIYELWAHSTQPPSPTASRSV